MKSLWTLTLMMVATPGQSMADECTNIPLENRTCCGKIGISPNDCLASGCCYDDLHAGTYFCFNKGAGPPAPPCPRGLDGVKCDINFTASTSAGDTKAVPLFAGCHFNGTYSQFSMNAQTIGSNVLFFSSANLSQSVVPKVYFSDPIRGACNCPSCDIYVTLPVVNASNHFIKAFCANANGFSEGSSWTGWFSTDVTSWLHTQPNGDYFMGLYPRPFFSCQDAINSVQPTFTSGYFGPGNFGQALWKVTKM